MLTAPQLGLEWLQVRDIVKMVFPGSPSFPGVVVRRVEAGVEGSRRICGQKRGVGKFESGPCTRLQRNVSIEIPGHQGLQSKVGALKAAETRVEAKDG